jgi:hypothetical protein
MVSVSVVHAELVEGVSGLWPREVLLAMDDAGVGDVLATVRQAAEQGSAGLDHGATSHQFLIEPGAADVELHDGSVVWRLDAAVAAEIIELLTAMHGRSDPGHHYVDISTPAQVLVLSRNEHLDHLPAEATFP